MWALISPRRVVRAHFDTLKDDANPIPRYIIFFVIPIIVSLSIAMLLQRALTNGAIAVLVPAYALLTGLLLNIVFLLLGSVVKIGPETEGDAPRKAQSPKKMVTSAKPKRTKQELLRHLYANALYSILVSMVTLFILIFLAIIQPWSIADYMLSLLGTSILVSPAAFLLCVSAVVYFLIAHFIMNLLMILKRLHSLYE